MSHAPFWATRVFLVLKTVYYDSYVSRDFLALLKVRKSQKIFFSSSNTARAEISKNFRWFFEYLKTRKNSSDISWPLYFLEEFVQYKLQPYGNLDSYLRYYSHCRLKCLGGVIHYLKNKVGVVDFANAQGLVMF